MRDIEIFNLISNRLVEATMMHNELSDLFTYLGLKGFAKAQEYQFLSEGYEMREVNRYAISHIGSLIDNSNVKASSYIPSELRNLSRFEVNSMDKRDVVRYAIETWLTWETETKELYSNWCVELNNNHCVASALFVEELVKDVDDELERVSDILVELKNVNFDMNDIALIQKKYYEEYCLMIMDRLRTIRGKEW